MGEPVANSIRLDAGVLRRGFSPAGASETIPERSSRS
jgi:hypothetical protein